jgi:hypothetical protein
MLSLHFEYVYVWAVDQGIVNTIVIMKKNEMKSLYIRQRLYNIYFFFYGIVLLKHHFKPWAYIKLHAFNFHLICVMNVNIQTTIHILFLFSI